MNDYPGRIETEIRRADPARLPRRDAGPWVLRFTRRQDGRNSSTNTEYLTQGELIGLWQQIGVLFNLAGMRDKAQAAEQEKPYRGGMHEHDGYAPHSHEVRADHLGVDRS